MESPGINKDRYPECDVLVAGGGMAGIAAAIASARSGAKTMLVEKNGWLGGMGITGATGLHSFFNIFDAHPESERMRVVAGIAQELVDKVQKLGGGMGHVRMERGGDFLSMLTPVEPETFKLAAARTCLDAGVKLLLHSVVDEVRSKDGHVEGIIVWNKAGRGLVQARQYIDCTGDGDLAAYAGAPFEHYKPGERGAYSAGFTFRLCNIDLVALEDDLERRGAIWHLAHAIKPGTSRPDLVRLGEGRGLFSVRRGGVATIRRGLRRAHPDRLARPDPVPHPVAVGVLLVLLGTNRHPRHQGFVVEVFAAIHAVRVRVSDGNGDLFEQGSRDPNRLGLDVLDAQVLDDLRVVVLARLQAGEEEPEHHAGARVVLLVGRAGDRHPVLALRHRHPAAAAFHVLVRHA